MANCPVQGDLTNDDTIRFWKAAIQQQLVLAVIASPPLRDMVQRPMAPPTTTPTTATNLKIDGPAMGKARPHGE